MAQNPTINEMLGGSNILGLLDPTGAFQKDAERRAQNALLANFAFAALQSSRGQPGQGAPSLGQIIGQAGPVGVQAYQQSFDRTLGDLLKSIQIRQSMAEANAPKYGTIKTEGGGEVLYQIPRGGGAPSVVPLTGIPSGRRIDFDAQTQAFIDFKFGKPFSDLSPDQKLEVIKFQNAPNAEKETTLKLEAEKFQFESGRIVTLPQGRGSMLNLQPAPPSTAPVAPPPAAPDRVTPSPTSAAPSAGPEVTPTAGTALRVPLTLVSQTMGPKDVPLINSPQVSPKQKLELEAARPATQGSVEYVINTNREMRNLISQILANPGLKDAFGFGGETLSKIPGSPAADVRASLERLGGQMFIDAITALRNASKTGAGVGNATEREGDKLERSKAALQQFQSAEAATRELTRLLKSLEEAERNVINAYERTYGRGTFQFTPLTTPEARGNRPPLTNIFGPQQ